MTLVSELPRKRGLLWPTLFTAVICTFLTSLGVWQLHRLKWKEALLAEIASRSHAAPQSPPAQGQWTKLTPQAYDYRHVLLAGRLLAADTVLVFDGDGPKSPLFSSVGYRVLEPLQLPDGSIIIVNRGFVPGETPATARARISPSPASVRISGVMRPPEARNFFTPADDPETGRWYTRDPREIAAAFHLAPVAPFLVDADATPVGEGPVSFPLALRGAADIPNNHFNYAMTWFGLALGILGMFISFVIKSLRGLA